MTAHKTPAASAPQTTPAAGDAPAGAAGGSPRRSRPKRSSIRYPNPSARCGHTRCGRVLRSHVGVGLPCPSGNGQRFLVSKRRPDEKNPPRTPMSFSAREVDFLAQVMQKLQSGGDTRLLAQLRPVELGSLHGKVQRARKRGARKQEPAAEAAQNISPSGASPGAARDGISAAGPSREGAC